jgi:hypothetical protein
MEKFNRVYSLSVEVDNGVNTSPLLAGTRIAAGTNKVSGGEDFRANKSVTIGLPFTIEFDIDRRGVAGAQTGVFRIYNLAAQTRNIIHKDQFLVQQLRAIQFRAGYESPAGDFMPMVFNGTVRSAYSYRSGVNFITEINAYDGGWQMTNNNQVAVSLPRGVTVRQSMIEISKFLTGLSEAPIFGIFDTTTKRGETLFGNAWLLLQQMSGFLATIDNSQLKVLAQNEVIEGPLPIISPASGLLGSPMRGDKTLDFEMIFEPRLTIFQIVQLVSFTQPQYNRFWKIQSLKHRGMISPRVSGDCLTSVSLFFTPEDFAVVSP